MARVTEALIDQKAFGRGANHPMLDLTYGGQGGWAPQLTEWVSNQAYIRHQVIPVLLEAPRFFQYMPDPDKWVQCLKSLIETHVRTIEGLNAGLSLDLDEHPAGGAGEMQQEVTDSKRARTEPVLGFVEKYGMPIQTFLSEWIRYGIMDPDTKYAMINTLPGANRPTDMLADMYSASVLFMEPDPTHRKVMKSWVSSNFFPRGTGDIIGRRDLTAASEVNTLSIEFTAITQYNLGSNYFAQQILDAINMTAANPNLRPSFVSQISADVAAAQKGYRSTVEDLGRSAVTPAG
jgi:hypothetical protein